MAEITAALVKTLRERTGAGMMECKRGSGGGQGRPGRGRGIASQVGDRVGWQEVVARHQAGADRQLHPCGRAARRDGGSQLRIGFRGPHRRFQGTGPRRRHARGRGRSALSCARKTFPRRFSTRKKRLPAPARWAKASPKRCSTASWKAGCQKFYEEVCLLDQPFVKEATMTIEQLVKTKIAKLGENISIARFVRFKVGDAAAPKPPAETWGSNRNRSNGRLQAYPAEAERRGAGGRSGLRHRRRPR